MVMDVETEEGEDDATGGEDDADGGVGVNAGVDVGVVDDGNIIV